VSELRRICSFYEGLAIAVCKVLFKEFPKQMVSAGLTIQTAAIMDACFVGEPSCAIQKRRIYKSKRHKSPLIHGIAARSLTRMVRLSEKMV